jgi:hypothetical protein
MVHLPKSTVITDDNNPTSIEFTWGKTIRFESLEFITDRFNNLSFSPDGSDLGSVFLGMVQGGSPSLYTILEEFTSDDDSTSSDGGSSSFPIS